jgi:hypothetical protein
MITIENAESALKNVFLESVITDINQKTNPFLTMVQENAKAVGGKEARTRIRYGNESSVTTGIEGGNLPRNTNGKSVDIAVDLKNLYGTFEISDKAIRAAQNDSAAFADLLAGEMQNLAATAQANLNAMVYGNGRKFLAYTENLNTTTKTAIVPERFVPHFTVGMSVQIMTADNVVINTYLVDAINATTNAIEFDGPLMPPQQQDRLYIYAATDAGTEMNGVDSIFRKDGMYGLAASAVKGIAPCEVAKEANLAVEVLGESEIMKFFDKYEEHCQGMPADILLTHPIVRKAVFENLKNTRTNVDTAELAGGFRGFSFNGVPVYSDIKCKGGTLYALNSKSWAIHQLCDWTWLSGDDGSILRQIDGRAGYSATLVKYADLLCDKPFIQGKVTNYSAKKAN